MLRKVPKVESNQKFYITVTSMNHNNNQACKIFSGEIRHTGDLNTIKAVYTNSEPIATETEINSKLLH